MEDSHYQSIFSIEATHWWYRVRREIALDTLQEFVPKSIHSKVKILDAGCGAGGLLKALQPLGLVYGIDIAPQAVEFCHTQGIPNVGLGDVTKIPYIDDSFDVVFALDVVEHIQHDQSALRELYRVVRPGGHAVISVPAFQLLWGITDELSHHARRYRHDEIVAKLKQAGFKIRRATYFNTFLFLPIAGVRLIARSLGIHMKSENVSLGFFNRLLYYIFHLESKLLHRVNFPFGISILVVARK